MILSRRQPGWFGLLGTALLVWGTTPAPAQVTLRYRFQQGEQLPYVMEQKMTMTMKANGQDIEMKMNQALDLVLQVRAVESDGKARIAQTFRQVHFRMEGGPMGTLEYDSKAGKKPEGPVGEMLGSLYEAMIGSAFTFTMDSRGQVTDVQVPKKVTEALQKAPGPGGMGEMFSADGLKRMISQSMTSLPQGPVTKGQSWEQKIDLKMPLGTMKGENVMTYEGPVQHDGKELQQIAIKPKLNFEAGQNAAMKLDLKNQQAQGTVYFDNRAGRLVESHLKQTLDLELGFAGQQIPQKVNQDITMKLAGKTP